MIISIWDNGSDDFIRYNFTPTLEDMREYRNSLTNKDLLMYLMPYCEFDGDFFKFTRNEDESIFNKKDVMNLYQKVPEQFRQLAMKYLLYRCNDKPLQDDMREFFKTYAEIAHNENKMR